LAEEELQLGSGVQVKNQARSPLFERRASGAPDLPGVVDRKISRLVAGSRADASDDHLVRARNAPLDGTELFAGPGQQIGVGAQDVETEDTGGLEVPGHVAQPGPPVVQGEQMLRDAERGGHEAITGSGPRAADV